MQVGKVLNRGATADERRQGATLRRCKNTLLGINNFYKYDIITIMMFLMLMVRPLRQEEERREKEIDPKHNRRIELLRKSRNLCYYFVNDDICTDVALEEE